MENNIYIDEPAVVSFFIGEFGWFLQRWQARLRFLKKKKYPDHKFLLMTDLDKHVFVQDFIHITIGLPEWFHQLNLERDCFEAPVSGGPPGGLTPPDVYTNLIDYFRQFYNIDKAIEIWPPRGCNYSIDKKLQLFCKYTTELIHSDRPIITILPRRRERASQRNVPVSVWREVVDQLKKTFLVVLAGTPNGACLEDYEDKNVVNLIKYNKEDKTDKVIQYLNSSVCSISSQSGGTHVSLLSGCPSYIIGHEKERHCETENRLNVPTTFRKVPGDYRAISAELIIADVTMFIQSLDDAGYFNNLNDVIEKDVAILNQLINETME